MKVVGLITEYNPFHNGHLYHLQQSKKICSADAVVVVMSGNFVQRGLPALVSKWTRAKMALSQGVDLVIELPTAYATRSAESFAFGAVSLLAKTNIVTHLCFGSESGNIKDLEPVAKLLASEPLEYKAFLKEYLNQGLVFPLARSKALASYFQEQEKVKDLQKALASVSNPNNILGVEYLKALYQLNSSIIPYTIGRIISGYNDASLPTNQTICSATSIRKALTQDHYTDLRPYMPQLCWNLLSTDIKVGKGPVLVESLTKLIKYKLISEEESNLVNILEINEGLHNKFKTCIKATTYEDIVNCIKSKRYTQTKIQRLLLHLVLGYTHKLAQEFDSSGGPQYIRILGTSQKGRVLIKRMKTISSLPIITKFSSFYKDCQGLTKAMLDLEIRSSNLYSLLQPAETNIDINSEFTVSPHIES